MRWEGQRESGNIEDRRGLTPARGAGIGLGGIVLVLAVSFITGTNPLQILNMLSGLQEVSGPVTDEQRGPIGAPKDELGRFAAVVLADTEDTWKALLPAAGRRYQEPQLVLFTGAVHSACGTASSAVGPFYCPGDRKVYLDLTFFDELEHRFRAPGDFAQAYVIAHEIGHHVQNLLGIDDRVRALQASASTSEKNALSVRMELQADFLAGVWANHANKRSHILEPGDMEEGLRAASAIGDDKLQRQSQGYVVPDAFTHGSSEQRIRWFRKAMETGDIKQGDTFSADRL